VSSSWNIGKSLNNSGYVLLQPGDVEVRLELPIERLNELAPSWARLPRDTYLRDGGRYRHRRHSCFVQELDTDTVTLVPHRAHWQPTDYNALHGGMERWFEPIETQVVAAAIWSQLLRTLGLEFAGAAAVTRWYVEAHQFRIDTASGIGRPTPEGAHRDGVDYVAVILIDRRDVSGGETRVFMKPRRFNPLPAVEFATHWC
jgi:hypothetical protein